MKSIPSMGNIPLQPDQGPGYRNRYDAHPFEDIPPGIEPPVPGFEPSPFEKPPFAQPGSIDRDRLPVSTYRDHYRTPSYAEGPQNYRDISIPPVSTEIPVHVGDQPRYRDNFRPGPYRDQSSIPFRDGQPYRDVGLSGAYRDPNFRGGPPPFRENSYRNIPYREGFREHPHTNFREGAMPYRPPSADPRESTLPSLLDPNYRDNFRDDSATPRDHTRSAYRPNMRSRIGPRRNPNMEHERHREREGRDRDRDRYNENRDPTDRSEKVRDAEKRSGHDKNREGREERQREYEKNKEYEKERDNERISPDKRSRVSPKRSREIREKKRSESRDRSRDHERDGRRDKKEDRNHDKTSTDRNRDHKEKEKKIKERKKKKREKEKDSEKKKKRERKEKKEKDANKKEDEDIKNDTKNDTNKSENTSSVMQNVANTEKINQIEIAPQRENSPKPNSNEKPKNYLYDEEAAGAVDKEIIQNYVNNEDTDTTIKKNVQNMNSDEPFDGIELQINTDELDLKPETETTSNKEMLAPMPELSKWEVEEENVEKAKEPGEITSPEEEENSGKVTSDVIKRAENAIFAKAINSLRPIEIKKISSDRLKLYGDEQPKTCMNNIQITVPVVDTETRDRAIEINDKKKRHSKTPPPRLSVKDRLGGKVDEIRRGRETRVVHSTVERVKSRSKTPKKEQPYRRVTVEKERSKKQDTIEKTASSKNERIILSEGVKVEKQHGSNIKRDSDKNIKVEKAGDSRHQDKNDPTSSKTPNMDRERKKSTLDEAHFEPDYDENVDSDTEMKEESVKKRERPISPSGREQIESKKPKIDTSSIKFDLTNVKKKPDTESDTSSDSEFSSSSSSSDARKRKKKKKRTKKKKKRAASESDSESGSSSDDHKKKKKKRKHKKKSSKKKKKSKHK